MLVPKLLLTPIKIRIFGPKMAKFGQKSSFLVILGQILPFLHILSNARPKNNVNKVPRWVFRYVGNKAYDFSSKKKDFLPKNDQIWPKIGIFGQFGPGHAGLFSALLVGRLVVVARGLYLARHLFTLFVFAIFCLLPQSLRKSFFHELLHIIVVWWLYFAEKHQQICEHIQNE